MPSASWMKQKKAMSGHVLHGLSWGIRGVQAGWQAQGGKRDLSIGKAMLSTQTGGAEHPVCSS